MEKGWHTDPESPDQLRFWNGRTWTDATAEAPSQESPPPPPPPPEPRAPMAPVLPPPPPTPSPSWGEIWAEIQDSARQHLPAAVTQSAGHFVLACVGLALLLGGCFAVVNRAANPPTTQVEVCAAYRQFVAEWFTFSPSDGFFDNDAFDAMEDLADVAQRYPDSEAVREDGRRLEELAEGDGGFIVSVSAYSAERASQNIARACF